MTDNSLAEITHHGGAVRDGETDDGVDVRSVIAFRRFCEAASDATLRSWQRRILTAIARAEDRKAASVALATMLRIAPKPRRKPRSAAARPASPLLSSG